MTTQAATTSEILVGYCQDGHWDCDKRGADREGIAERLTEVGPVTFARVSVPGFETLVARHGLGLEFGLELVRMQASRKAPADATLH